MDDQLIAALEDQNHRLEQAAPGVEAQAEFSVGRAVVVEGLDPQRPLGRLDRILGRDAVLERALVDLHAAKWASAARIASDLLMSFLAAAASRAADLLGGQPDRHDLHRFSPPTRTPTTSTLQLIDVVASFGLIGPLLDLLFAHHLDIV